MKNSHEILIFTQQWLHDVNSGDYKGALEHRASLVTNGDSTLRWRYIFKHLDPRHYEWVRKTYHLNDSSYELTSDPIKWWLFKRHWNDGYRTKKTVHGNEDEADRQGPEPSTETHDDEDLWF
jgi:hypothetical protein